MKRNKCFIRLAYALNVIKVFDLINDNPDEYARVLGRIMPFRISKIFIRKARSLPLERVTVGCSGVIGLGAIRNCQTRLKYICPDHYR